MNDYHPACGWMENTSGDDNHSYKSYQSGKIIFKILSVYTKDEEVLEIMEDYTKIYRFGPHWGILEHYIGKWTSNLPNICVPVTKSRLDILEA